MGFSYLTVEDMIEQLSKLDKRKYRHNPYISKIEYNDKGECKLTLVTSSNGGTVKRLKIGGKQE